MRWIVWYLRSCFCAHEWNYEEIYATYSSDLGTEKNGMKVSATCKKCGWHRSYWKF